MGLLNDWAFMDYYTVMEGGLLKLDTRCGRAWLIAQQIEVTGGCLTCVSHLAPPSGGCSFVHLPCVLADTIAHTSFYSYLDTDIYFLIGIFAYTIHTHTQIHT